MSERRRSTWSGRAPSSYVLASALLLFGGARSVGAQPVIIMSKGQAAAAFDSASGYIESPQTVSADGRYVVFTSASSNVVPGQGDGNGAEDVFLFDGVTKNRFLVSHVAGDDKKAGDAPSTSGKISSDGKWVVFTSQARDLVSPFNDGNGGGGTDVFLYQVSSGKVLLVSHQDGAPDKSGDKPSGANGDSSIAADGSYVTFTSDATTLAPGQADTNAASDVFIYETATDKMFLVSHQDGDSKTAAKGLSENPVVANGPDGVFVTYESTGIDLVPAQSDNPGSKDIFLYELQTETNVLVSGRFGSTKVAAGSTTGPSRLPTLDQKAAFVFFLTSATDLVSGVTDDNGLDDVYRFDRGPGILTLISHSAGNFLKTGNKGSGGVLAVSPDQVGARVAFESVAQDLVAGQSDPSVTRDVFVWNSADGSILLASRSNPGDGKQTGDHDSYGPSLSQDGNSVAFESLARNLVASQADANGQADIFLFDLTTTEMVLVSHKLGSSFTTAAGGGGLGFAALNGDGKFVAHVSDATDLTTTADTNSGVDVFLFTRSGGTGTNEVVSLAAAAAFNGANASSQTIGIPPANPANSVSDDGRYVVFTSEATNLVAGQVDNNGAGARDVFLYDRGNDSVTLVSHRNGLPLEGGSALIAFAGVGCQQPVISGDGNYVAYACTSTDIAPGQIDANNAMDVFLWNRATNTNELVSHRFPPNSSTTMNAASNHPVISGAGEFVAYETLADNFGPVVNKSGGTDVYIFQRGVGPTLDTRCVSHKAGDPTTTANNDSSEPVITADGKFVAFTSLGTDLVAGQVDIGAGATKDVFRWANSGGGLTLISRVPGSATDTAGGNSDSPSMSDDGQRIALRTTSTTIVTGGETDLNGVTDIVLLDEFLNSFLLSRRPGGGSVAGNQGSTLPLISRDGNWVAYSSSATDLVSGQIDANAAGDAFLFDVAKRDSTNTNSNQIVSHVPGNPTQTGNGSATATAISIDGGRVALFANATNLAAGQVDPNGATDVFVWDRTLNGSLVASRARGTAATTGNGVADVPALSGNGKAVVFRSAASNLVNPDANGFEDAFYLDVVFADLKITKTALTPAVPGANMKYQIVAENVGGASVTGATVTDTLPATLLSATWTCVPVGGATCTLTGAGNINDTVNLPVGGRAVYQVDGTLSLTPTFGSVTNKATITPPVDAADTDLTNNESTVTTPLTPNAPLTLAHVDSPDPVFTLGPLTYVSTITNGGPSIADTVSLQVQVPAGATFVSVIGATCSFSAGFVTCTHLGNLQPAASLSVTVNVNAPGTPGTMVSLATADSGSSSSVSATATTQVLDSASSLIEFLTVTSTDSTNALEWRTPPLPGYDHTRIQYRAGACPTGPFDGTNLALPPVAPSQPGPGAKGFAQHLGLPNNATVCYAAYVARDAAETSFSPPIGATGRPFVTTGPAKWAFSTAVAAVAVVPPGIGGAGVYVPSNDRALYGIARGASGGQWLPGYTPMRFQAPVQSRPPVVPFTIGPATLVTFVSSQDGNVFAVDANAGDPVPTNGIPDPAWTRNVATSTQAAPAGWFQAFGGAADWAFIGTRIAGNNSFHALLAGSGAPVTPNGTFDNGGVAIGAINGGAAVDYANKRVYFTSRTGATTNTAWCLPLITTAGSEGFGPPCWAMPVGDIDYGPVLRNNVVYVASNTGAVIALDAISGASLWTFGGIGLPKGFVVTDRANDDLYITAGSTVWGLKFNDAMRWKVTTIPNPSQPLFARIGAGTFVFVGSGDGQLYQVDATNGGNIKSVVLGDGLSQIGAPSFDGVNSLIYVGSDSGVIHAVRVPLP